MATSFAALVYRPSEIPDRALSQGFAVALAGWDVPAPHLSIAPLAGAPGWAVAFYASGAKVPRGGEDEAFDLACELFDDEPSPALAVLDAAADLGHADARVYAITYAEGIFHDDVWRFDAQGFERRFVHEGEHGVEAGVETAEGAEDVDIDLPEGEEDARAVERAVKPHRGSTWLSAEIGTPALAALVGALFAVERRVDVRLAEAGAEAIAAETRRLDATLGRTEGRGAFAPPEVAGRAAPAAYEAFARTYDWADPRDPADLYRELSIGAIEGTLHFHRLEDLRKIDADAAWKQAAAEGLYPVAALRGSALGGGGPEATLALAADGDALRIVKKGAPAREAGPTFGELIRYLALGWAKRSEAEDDMIDALMLRARIRSEAAGR
jgi:hypothetical protein